ncbi:MAG TPA: hypothetical protein VFH42_08370, partial [Sporolactobacillaceae bacterium]|nr:hypothetical protein [Sporolactobacillaceae bacterium]
DKERDVTQQVKDTLGLTHDDFTRAVVLPQGKFAEFLSLKGADRRRMLQRLFNMEKYGDRLNDVIKGRLNIATSRLESIQSAQIELGDASKEALELAQKAYRDADQQVTTLSKQFQEMKEVFEAAKQKREWQIALQHTLETEQSLIAGLPEIEAKRERLSKARLAAQVIPYVLDYEMVEQALLGSRIEKEKAEKAFEVTSSLETEKKQDYETTAERVLQETPIYEKRRETLREAIRIQDEMTIKEKGLFQLKAGRDQINADLERKQKLVNELTDARDRFHIEREKLRVVLQEERIDYQTREQITKALAEKLDIENKRTSYNEWLAQQKLLKSNVVENDRQAKAEKVKVEKVVEELRTLFSKYEAVYYHAASTKKGLDMVLDWLVQKEEDGQKKIQEATITHLATELAAQLRDGAPCPVCGAVHHPNPAETKIPDQTTELKEEVQFLRQCSQWINKAITSAGSYQTTIEQRVNQIQDLSSELIPGIHSRKEMALPDLSAWMIEDLKTWMTLTKTDLQGFKQDILELDEQLKPLVDRYQKITKQYLILMTQRENIEQQEKTTSEKIKALRETLEGQHKVWSETYPTLDYQNLEQVLESMHRQDQRAQEVNEQIEKLTHQLEVTEQKRQKLDSEVSDLKQQYARFDESIKETTKFLEILTADYKKAMGDVSVEADTALQLLDKEW